MNPENYQELVKMVQDLTSEVRDLQEWKRQRIDQQLVGPVDDTSRIVFGMGVAGEDTSATTPAKAVLVNTNVGQLKVLVAS